MGSDQSSHAVFEAVLRVSREIDPSILLVAIAKHSCYSDLKRQHADFGATASPIEFITTEESIEMDEAPLLAVRRKKRSTMAVGLRLLKEGNLDAFVSTGNTGALVTTAMLHLPLFPGIERAAFLVMLPNGERGLAVLDVGAHISAKPEHLVDYAFLGRLYRKCVHGIKDPTVGLLNIGVEEQKGTKELKETYLLLQKRFPEQFLGNIEGKEVFQGKIDVLVTDGFTGNVFLKTSEGVLHFLMEYLSTSFATKSHAEIQRAIAHLYQQFNYSEQPGAFLCGVEGIVIKCHGHSNTKALMNGILGAIELAKGQVIQKMKKAILSL